MLVLSRKVGEIIMIEGGITITVLETSKSRIRVGIEAPPEVFIRRSEIAFDSTPLVDFALATPQPSHACKGHHSLDA